MQVDQTPLPGVLILTPKRHGDDRGWFSESWNRATMANSGLDIEFVQDNHSMSAETGTLRGLHFQAPPFAQAKLVRCVQGLLFDVAVDYRAGSPTFGQWFGIELSPQTGQQLLIPEGFLHGFVTRAPDTEIAYKCTAHYAPEADGGVRWDDPDIGIDWGATSTPLLSAKDSAAPLLNDAPSPFTYEAKP